MTAPSGSGFQPRSKDFKGKGKEFVEQIEVAGDQLVAKIKELIADSSTKRVVIRSHDGRELLSVPMNVGVVGGGLVTLAAPMLAALGAVAALVTQVRVDVVREEEPSVEDVAADAAAENDPTGHA